MKLRKNCLFFIVGNNPVRAAIVAKPEEYLYSSARNYAGIDGVMEVIRLDLRWKTYGI